jgi:hypothetical protein
MEPLMTGHQLRAILERGLVTGKWSISQFNKGSKSPVLPSREFLEEHPKFLDADLRDMAAYHSHHHHPIL